MIPGDAASRLLYGSVTVWVLTLRIAPEEAHADKIVLALMAYAILLPVIAVFAYVYGAIQIACIQCYMLIRM